MKSIFRVITLAQTVWNWWSIRKWCGVSIASTMDGNKNLATEELNVFANFIKVWLLWAEILSVPTEKGKRMDKNCDNCINSGRPSYEWPCTACTTAHGSAPSKWESNFAKDTNVPSWIPVTERLPEQGQEVIVYSGGVLKPQVYCYLFWNPNYDSWARVTHWMSLPEPPK